MNELVIVRPEKCDGCNACVRCCPAPEANITKRLEDGRFITSVDPNKCIACGECVKVCQHGARDYVDDTEECMSRVVKEKMIIMASPAIKTVFPNKWKGILDWFKSQGCSVYDVSLGADICTWVHLRMLEQSKVGDSIAVNGACMTVINIEGNSFQIDVSAESLSKTANLGTFGECNLEKAMRLGDTIDGHMVSGHVDGIGQVEAMDKVAESYRLVILAPLKLSQYLAYKASVTVNGVSLTINSVPHLVQYSMGFPAPFKWFPPGGSDAG